MMSLKTNRREVRTLDIGTLRSHSLLIEFTRGTTDHQLPYSNNTELLHLHRARVLKLLSFHSHLANHARALIDGFTLGIRFPTIHPKINFTQSQVIA
jgi:hypothetical protein